MPSDGEHGIFSLKSLSFIFATGTTFGYVFLKQKINVYQLKLVSFLLFALSILIIWFFISLFRNETSDLARYDQFKLFIITLIIPLLTLYLVSEHILTSTQFFKAVIYSSMTYVSLKVVVVLLHLAGFVDIWSLMKSSGFYFMRMSIYGSLDRVQTSVDISTPFLIFFVLQSKHLGLDLSRFFKRSYFVLSLFSTFLSFSRYLLFVYFLSCFLYWLSLDFRGILKGILFFLVAAALGYALIGPETVEKIVERRLFSRDNFLSDKTRSVQAEALLDKFEQAPLLGSGVGGYVKEVIREPNTLHVYEVQWLAFLMQFGVIGIFLILSPLLFIAIRLVQGPFSRLRWSFLGLFLLWIFSGFTNPFLISLASGIIYSLFYLCGEEFKIRSSILSEPALENRC